MSGDEVVPDYRDLFAGLPAAFLVMTTDWRVVDVNQAYLDMLDRTRADLIGRTVFEVFPPDPAQLDATGVHPLQRAFEGARDTGRPQAMPPFRYDVVDPATGDTVTRYWSVVSAPLAAGADGGTRFVVQRIEDVTDYVQRPQVDPASLAEGRQWRERAEMVEADLYTRMQQLQAALDAKDVAASRLARLGQVALRLTEARDVADLERIVVGEGLAMLGAHGGAILSRDEDGTWRATISSVLGTQVQIDYAWFPYDSVNPAAWSARTGQRLVLPTVADGLAFDPVMEEVYRVTGRRGWVALPLRARDESLGALAVAWVEEHPVSSEELDVLDTFAAQCAQALDRLQALDAERAAAAAIARMSETLQRALLSAPPQPPGLQIAVRYSPAAHDAEVGGDWYDSFLTPDGTTHVVVGDVSGHDRDAAASMAQLRNVLRGIAYAVLKPPAAVLSWLDRAMRDLQDGVLATAVLAQITAAPSGPTEGHRRLCWSNAGHPPPLLIGPDGDVRLLGGEPELMLGVSPDADRLDHEVDLPPGSTVLMYTDGLVERRGHSLDAGILGLLDHVRGLAGLPLEDLCDAVLAMPHLVEDDIVLLAIRVLGQD